MSSGQLLSESLFGEALARSEIAAFLIRDEAIIAANEAASRLTGYGPDELLTLTVEELAAPRTEAEEAERVRRLAEAERGVWQSGPGKVLRKDGQVRVVHGIGGATAVGSTAIFLALVWEAENVDGEPLPAQAIASSVPDAVERAPARASRATKPAARAPRASGMARPVSGRTSASGRR